MNYYVVDEHGAVVQRDLTIGQALVLCYKHKEYSICEWDGASLRVVPQEKIKVA